ncbi:hypothetical protein [Streptomyces anulatus]|uniref:hypothetical protein n=1 Tax=Streptomyces anulatus TaxID=1892 RepID=UPI003F4A68FD
MTRSLPEISARGLAGLVVALPALANARIAVTGGRGTAKPHVPPPGIATPHGQGRAGVPFRRGTW